jgi:NAD(P)-dependent dehydrogenase (short-subunit alcohol dehydrogenase family)
MADMRGKVAVITGAASGVGEATAKRFAREGMSVVATDMNEEGLARVAREIEAEGGKVLAFTLDVTDSARMAQCFTSTIDAFGRLDVLINNAGMASSTTMGDRDVWDPGIDATLSSVYWMSKGALPHLEVQGGAIVNIASIGGNLIAGTATWYCAAKAGVMGITRSYAALYGSKGIRTNAVALGAIDTPRVRSILDKLPPGAEEASNKRRPLGRIGRPEEIAACALFLASDEASYVNGQMLVADGGSTLTSSIG